MGLLSDRKLLFYLGAIVISAIGAVALIAYVTDYADRSDSSGAAHDAVERPRETGRRSARWSPAAEAEALRAEQARRERIEKFLGPVTIPATKEELLARLSEMARNEPPDLEGMLRLILQGEQSGLLKSKRELIELLGPGTIEEMAFRAVTLGEPVADIWALAMFGEMRTERAVPQIVEILKTRPDDRVKQAALAALCKIGSDAAVAALRQAVGDESYGAEVRRFGIHALGESYKKGRTEVYDDFVALLDTSTRADLRTASVLVLSRVRTPQALARLIRVVREDASVEVRKDALHLLAAEFSSDAGARAEVHKVMLDPAENKELRLVAIARIAAFGDKSVVPDLVTLAAQDMSFAKTAGNALRTLDPGGSIDLLDYAIRAGAEEVRLNLIEAISLIRSDRSRQTLVRLRDEDPSEQVRKSASHALAGFAAPR